MKIFITNTKEVMNGYTTVSPYEGHDIESLDFIEPASCDEIICNSLDYISYNNIEQVLAIYVSKLRHKGKIILCGTDIIELNKMRSGNWIDNKEYNLAIYGDQKHPWGFKKGMYDLYTISLYLLQLKLKIIKQRISGSDFIVEGYRE